MLLLLCHITLHSCSKIKFECSQEGVYFNCVANGLNIQASDKNVSFEMTVDKKTPEKVIIQESTVFFLPDIFKEFTHLKELVAKNISLEEINSATFADASKLRYLILSNNRIKTLIDNTFINSSELLSLKLQHNQIKTLSSQTFFGLTELRTLILSFNLIANLPLYIFRDLTSLDSLHLDNNQIKVVSSYQFSTNFELTVLHLEMNEISTIDDETFEDLDKLERIYLSNNICVDENFSPWFISNRTALNCCSKPPQLLQNCLNKKIKNPDRDGFRIHLPLVLTLSLSIIVNFTVLSYCLIKQRRSNQEAEQIELITANDLNGSAYQVY